MKSKRFVLAALIIAVIGLGIWWFTRPTTAMAGKSATAPMPATTTAPQASPVEPPKLPAVAPSTEKTASTPATAATPLAMDDPVAIDARIAEVISNLQKAAPLSPRLQIQLDALLAVKGKSAVMDENGNSGRYDPVFVDDQQVQVILMKRNGHWVVNFKAGDGLKTPSANSSANSSTRN